MNSWKNIGIFAFSALSLGIVACSGSDGAAGPAGAAGSAGAAGPAGPAGEGVKPSAGVVVPNIGLLDRELDVTVTGDAIDFTVAAPTLDFGAGVTVSKIQVLSGTTLVAHLAVDAAATTGARDVKITEGATVVTAKGGFSVAAPLRVTTTPTNLAQASINDFAVDNLDLQHAFDTASGSFVMQLDAFGIGALSVTATHASGLFLIDPAAPATTTPLAANIDGAGFAAETYAGTALTVAPRAPVTVTPGTPLTAQTIATAGGTGLHKFTTATTAILEVGVTATGAKLRPFIFAYGDSGTAADMLDNSTSNTFAGTVVFPSLAGKNGYLVVLDGSLGGGAVADYGYTADVKVHTATVFPEPTTAHDTLANATTNAAVTALPLATTNNGDVVTGALATGAEEDWYEVTLAANDSLEVVFTPAFAGTLDVTDATSTSLFGTDFVTGAPLTLSKVAGTSAPSSTISQDAGGNALAAGKYYVHITSQDGTAKGNYAFSLRKR